MADKELDVRIIPGKGALYEIYYKGGGLVPEELRGSYTSDYVAKAALINYLTAQVHKEKARQEAKAIRDNKHKRMEELRDRDLV